MREDRVNLGVTKEEALKAMDSLILKDACDHEMTGLLWEPLSDMYLMEWSRSGMWVSDGVMDLYGTCEEG